MAKAKPFIKWVGGKSQLIDQLDALLPADFGNWKNVTYIEPFVGGGAMLFYMLQRYPNIQHAVINDINPDLTTCYRTVRDTPELLIKSLMDIETAYLAIESEEGRKDFFLAARDRYNEKNLNPVENTTYFFFLNRTCYNGLYRVNKKGLFNVPFGKYANPQICDPLTIRKDSELLQRVEIMTGDFEVTFDRAKGNTLFYFDPPYRPLSDTSSFNDYAKDAFNDSAQIRLKAFCDRVNEAGFRFMLSNSDCKGKNENDNFFDVLYGSYHIERVWASRSINSNPNKRGKLTELVIRNFSQHTLKALTAEELINLPENKDEFMFEFGNTELDIFDTDKYKKDIAKTKNYKFGVYYHADGGLGNSGVGKGLYLGQDLMALFNFYNGEGEFGDCVMEYHGTPRFIDLVRDEDYKAFEQEAIQRYGNQMTHDHLKLLTLEKGFDGIRYFDLYTTGEEFVLYNTNSVHQVRVISNQQIMSL